MEKHSSPLRVALIHDYLREYGGAERVLEALHELYPDAPVYVAFVDSKALGIHWQKFQNWDIRQSWLTKIPGYKKLYSPLRILAPQFFQAFDLSEYDLVISSSNMYFAKAVKVQKSATHISYCHTPPRSLYGYTTMTNWKKHFLIRVGGTLINHYLRLLDFSVSQKVDFFIANSNEVKQRIRKFYRRESTVIYPPVNVPEKCIAPKKEYYLFVGRLAFAKHPDFAIQACNQLHLPLKVVGAGALLNDLKAMAGPTVEVLGGVTDDQLQSLYRGAKALLFPVEDEDFGIVPVEAMAYGLPVIAHRSGGVKETVIEGKTGYFFDELSVDGLKLAIQKAETTEFSHKEIYLHALKFSNAKFQESIRNFISAY